MPDLPGASPWAPGMGFASLARGSAACLSVDEPAGAANPFPGRPSGTASLGPKTRGAWAGEGRGDVSQSEALLTARGEGGLEAPFNPLRVFFLRFWAGSSPASPLPAAGALTWGACSLCPALGMGTSGSAAAAFAAAASPP